MLIELMAATLAGSLSHAGIAVAPTSSSFRKSPSDSRLFVTPSRRELRGKH